MSITFLGDLSRRKIHEIENIFEYIMSKVWQKKEEKKLLQQ